METINEPITDYQYGLMEEAARKMSRSELEAIASATMAALVSLEIPFNDRQAGRVAETVDGLTDYVTSYRQAVEAEAGRLFAEWLNHTVATWQESTSNPFNPWAPMSRVSSNAWRSRNGKQ